MYYELLFFHLVATFISFVGIFAVGYLWFYHTKFILKDSGTLTTI